MRKKGIACVLTLMMTMSLAACGNAAKSEGTDATTNFSVGMVSDTGGINDQSFNQSAWEGLKQLESEIGAKVGYVESVQEADYASNLDKMLDQDNDIIWGIGFSLANALNAAAEMNPDQLYGIVDHTYGDETLDNEICLMFRSQEAAFLVGYAAGMTTETGKVGFVGGISSDIIDQFEYGYRAGVAYAASEKGTNVDVSVQYIESFADAAKGKAIATKMFSDGCDVVFHSAGNAGTGVIEAAKDAGKFAIGADRDQYSLAPDNILTSALKKVDQAIETATKQVKDNQLSGGTVLEYGLKEKSVGIPTENPNMDPAVYEATIKVQQKILDGTIDVPYNAETFATFTAQ